MGARGDEALRYSGYGWEVAAVNETLEMRLKHDDTRMSGLMWREFFSVVNVCEVIDGWVTCAGHRRRHVCFYGPLTRPSHDGN